MLAISNIRVKNLKLKKKELIKNCFKQNFISEDMPGTAKPYAPRGQNHIF